MDAGTETLPSATAVDAAMETDVGTAGEYAMENDDYDPATDEVYDDALENKHPTMDIIGNIIADEYNHPAPQAGDAFLPGRVMTESKTPDAPSKAAATALRAGYITQKNITFVPKTWAVVRDRSTSPGAIQRRKANAGRCTSPTKLAESLLQEDYTLFRDDQGNLRMVTDAGVPDEALHEGWFFEPSYSMLWTSGWVTEISTGGVNGGHRRQANVDKYNQEFPNTLPTCLLDGKKRPASGTTTGSLESAAVPRKRPAGVKRATAITTQQAGGLLPADATEPHGIVNLWQSATFEEALVANTLLVQKLLAGAAPPKLAPRPTPKAPAKSTAKGKAKPPAVAASSAAASSSASAAVSSSASAAPGLVASSSDPEKIDVPVERWIDVALKLIFERIVPNPVAMQSVLAASMKTCPAPFAGFETAVAAGRDADFKNEFLGLARYVYTRYGRSGGSGLELSPATSHVAAALLFCQRLDGRDDAKLDKYMDESTNPLMECPTSADEIANLRTTFPRWQSYAIPVALLFYRDFLSQKGPQFKSGACLNFVPVHTQ